MFYIAVVFYQSLSPYIWSAGCNTWCLPNHNKIHVCNMHCQRIIRCMWAASTFAVRLSIDELWKALHDSLMIACWLECHCLRYLSLLTNHWVLVTCFTCCGSNVRTESNDHVICTSIFTMSYTAVVSTEWHDNYCSAVLLPSDVVRMHITPLFVHQHFFNVVQRILSRTNRQQLSS